MNFDLKTTPPTSHEIANGRMSCINKIEAIKANEKQLAKTRYARILILAIIIFLLQTTQHLNYNIAMMPAILMVGLMLGINEGKSSELFKAVYYLTLFIVAALTCNYLTFYSPAENAIGKLNLLDLVYLSLMMTGFAAIIIKTIAETVANIFYVTINEELDNTRSSVYELNELESSESPEECIEFVKLCRTSNTILAYQNQIATQGRRPVYGEYLAAKKLEENLEPNERQQQAKTACNILGAPIIN